MPDHKPDDRTLTERENDASERWNELYADAVVVEEVYNGLKEDVTRAEAVQEGLDDKAFEIAVQQSGALDMMNGPISQDGDGHLPIMEIVNARNDALHGEVVDQADTLMGIRADMRDLEHEIDVVAADIEDLADDVHEIRAEGGHIHPEATEAEAEEAEWMDERLDEAAHTE